MTGEKGNTFLFAHSSDNFYTANHYNTVFYLLHKLENGDQFFIVYDDIVYKYIVSGTQEVSPDAVQYLETNSDDIQTATLMTCWPPGTTSKRLLVFGELEDFYDL
jgi:sortase A